MGTRTRATREPLQDNPRIAPFDNESFLGDPKERAEWDALEDRYQLTLQMIDMRNAAGLTQARVAKRMGVTQSRVAQMESVNYAALPSLASLRRFAVACGYRLTIGFEPSAQANRRVARKAAEHPAKRYRTRRRAGA